MKKLNYLLITSGKFHYFEVAKILYERKNLLKIISGYPWFKLKKENIPKNFVECAGFFTILNHILYRVPSLNLNYFINNFDFFKKKTIDLKASKYLDDADILIASSSTGLISGKKIKNKNSIYCCDQSSAHILFENDLVNDEYNSLNYNREFFTDERIKQNTLQEYEESDFILVPSEYVKSTFKKNYHHKIFVNNFGINTKNFFPIENIIKDNKYFDIIYIGGISIRKGVHYLIDAFNNLNYSKKRLHLIGSHIENDKKFLKKRISQDNIIVYGHVPQLKLNEIINKCDVFVTATLSEGYANVINQAVASGCPVIVTENSGAKEYVQSNKCGFVVPIRDSKSISDKLTTILDDKVLLKNLTENSKNAGKNNTWVNYVNRLEEFINYSYSN